MEQGYGCWIAAQPRYLVYRDLVQDDGGSLLRDELRNEAR
jgi:hypothetical protein